MACVGNSYGPSLFLHRACHSPGGYSRLLHLARSGFQEEPAGFLQSHPSVILLAKASQKASQVLGLWSWSLSVRGVAKGCWGLHLQRLVGVWRWHSQTAFRYSFMAQSLPVLVSRQVGLVAVFPDFPASMTFSLCYSAVRTHASLPLSDVTHLPWPVKNIATTLMLRFCACF